MTRFLPIDPRPFKAQTRRCGSQSGPVQAALDFARIQFARVQDLVESKAIARQDYDTRKNAVDVGEAQVKQNQAAVESARLNLEYTSIRSPIDGRAGHRLVDVGNVVTANNSTLLNIERLDPIYADFTVTENDFSESAAPYFKRNFKGLRCVCRMNWTSRSLDNSRFSITPCKAAAGPFCFARRYPTAATGYGQGVL